MRGLPGKTPPRSRRGVGLATTLVIISIIVILAFAVAGVSISHLSVSTRLSNAEIARNRAESSLAQAIDRVIVDREAGTNFSGQVNLPAFAGEPAGTGTVCFDTLQAGIQGIPFSTNNLANDASVVGWNGRAVPGDGVHLIGIGTCNNVERRVEAVVFIPRFPYAIASSGPVSSQGGLQVASLQDPSLLAGGGLSSIPADKIEPGDLATNSGSATALDLKGNNVRITGDARASGGIDLGPSVLIEGAIRPNSDQVDIPDLDISLYDTAGKTGLQQYTNSESNLTVDGWARYSKATHGPDMYVSGGLRLDGGVLFVDGNLHVTGGISGNGAVIVTGTTEIFDGGTFAADQMAAVVSQGSVKIDGQAAGAAKFKGLIYTEGHLDADNIILAGAVVANAPGAGSSVSLDNVEMIQLPGADEHTLTVGGSAAVGNGNEPDPPGVGSNPAFNTWTSAPTTVTATGFGNEQYTVSATVNDDPQPTPADFLVGGTYDLNATNRTLIRDQLNWTVTVTRTSPPGQPPVVLPAVNAASFASDVQGAVTSLSQHGASAGSNWNSMNPMGGFINLGWQNYYKPSVPLVAMNDYKSNYGDVPVWSTGGSPGTAGETFTLSLNDGTFVDMKDKLKVLYWGPVW